MVVYSRTAVTLNDLEEIIFRCKQIVDDGKFYIDISGETDATFELTKSHHAFTLKINPINSAVRTWREN